MSGEAANHSAHQRRSSLSEALQGEPSPPFTIHVGPKDYGDDMDLRPESPFIEDLPTNTSSMGSVDTNSEIDHQFLPRKSGRTGIAEAEQSPFTPDSPVYELCAEANPCQIPKSSTSSIPSQLSTVPEDSPPPPEHLSSPLNTVGLVSPDKLKLKQVRTPRKSTPINNPFQMDLDRQDSDPDHAQKLQPLSARSDAGSVSSCIFKQQNMAFNPFDIDRQLSRQGTGSMEEDFFDMDIGSQKSQGEGISELRSLSLEKKNSVEQEHAQELAPPSPRETLKHLLAAVESMIKEIESHYESSQAHGIKAKEKEDKIAKLQGDLDTLRNEEADVDVRLKVIHSQLEAHLLSNLEQEDGLRISGERLKAVKEEINALDVSLSVAEEQRRDLEHQLAEIKASKLPPSEREQQAENDGRHLESPKSNYSSAWETSDSESENYLDVMANEPRHRTLSEDNQAKMSQQGARGGPWLKGMLKHRSRKDGLPAPIQGKGEDVETPKGGGMSHFQLPTTNAALEKASDEEEEEEGGKESKNDVKIAFV